VVYIAHGHYLNALVDEETQHVALTLVAGSAGVDRLPMLVAVLFSAQQ
jgi:hypothetical protein